MYWFKNRSKLFEKWRQKFWVFVAHRVNKIRNHTTFDEWHYVPTEENIADFTTRYQEFPQLINNKNWFYWPDFLQAFEFNTFGSSPVLQNNLMNIKDVNIITKSKYDVSRVYYEIQSYVGRKIDTLKVSQKWMKSKWTKISLSVLGTILGY